MKIFDSIKDKRWAGRGMEVNSGLIVIMKSAEFSQPIVIHEGNYLLKFIGRKRTGDGRFRIRIVDPQNKEYFNKEILITSSSWSELSHSFSINKDLGICKIEITRDKKAEGSLEIGRLFVDIKKTYNIRNYRKERISSSVKSDKIINSKENNIGKNNNEEKSLSNFEFKNNIVFIIPYKIYGGAEIYLKDIINHAKLDKYNIHILYMNENQLQDNIITKNVSHRIVTSLQQLSGIISSNNYDYIVYYNRADIYNLLSTMKSEGVLSGRLIEIYHSDFTWTGSVSLLTERKNLDKLIVIGKSLGTNISGIQDSKRRVVPVGIDLNRFTIRNSSFVKTELNIKDNGKKIIGTVARLSKEKNIPYIIQLAEIMEDFRFIVIGSGSEKKSLEDMMTSLNIKNVELIGFKDNIEKYYNIFDAFLLPSIIEGTPISIIEAMASGVPVFASKVGAIPDIIENGKTGFFLSGYIENDVSLISENIDNFKIISNAREYVTINHNIKNNADLFFKSIQSTENYFIGVKNSTNTILLGGEYI